MEILALRSSITQAKIMGTIASISGALVVVFYKGPTIISPSSESLSPSLHFQLDSSKANLVIGALLIAAEYLLVSIWYIVQTQVIKTYPSKLIVVFLNNLCGTIISAPLCLLAEGNFKCLETKARYSIGRHYIFSKKHGLPNDNNVLTFIISDQGFASSFSTVVHTWGLHLKGPVYVSNFKPLSIAIAAAMCVIFLGDALYLGSVIGAIILSIGFYAVIWAKAKE